MNKKKKAHVKLGDRIKIIAGSQKGLLGCISAINLKKETVIIDTSVPRVKFLKARKDNEPKKIELPISINISNVMLWDNEANISSKIGYKFLNNEKKRYFKKSGNILELKKD
jgi:large subunit ribosomal protein L24